LAAKPKCFGKKATIVGTSADNVLKGTKKADVIVGKGGDDTIDGKGGNDLICSGGGDDNISGGGGSNKLSGGTGQDQALYDKAKSGVDADLSAGEATVGNATDELTGIEHAAGSPFDDTLKGNGGSNTFDGLAGDDDIDGGDGDDTLFGDIGDDDLNGGLGVDELDGGEGVDVCLDGENLLDCEDTGFEEFTFPNARLQGTLTAPIPLQVVLNGEVVTRVHNAVQDVDTDGLEELAVEVVAAELTGSDPLLGQVVLTARSVAKHPNQPTEGTIEELVNGTPGIVEIPNFGPGAGGIGAFEVFFEVSAAGLVLHNHDPIALTGAITQWPPPAGAPLAGPNATLTTFNEDESSAPAGLASVILTLVP
jgi:hypothetical protein